jgi:GMP synthase-like glutamine amidotransferase
VDIGILQHVAGEPSGYLETVFQDAGIPFEYHPLYETNELPLIAGSHILIMGGSMSANDEPEFPFLREEKALIRRSVAEGKAVWGICLGAQLIASAFGAKVYPSREEVGWGSVRWTSQHPAGLPAECRVFQFHGDTFDLPAEGTLLGAGGVVHNQALAVGSAVGFQFHIEMTRPLIDAWIRDRPGDQRQRILDDTIRFLPESHRICRQIAEAFLTAPVRNFHSWFC